MEKYLACAVRLAFVFLAAVGKGKSDSVLYILGLRLVLIPVNKIVQLLAEIVRVEPQLGIVPEFLSPSYEPFLEVFQFRTELASGDVFAERLVIALAEHTRILAGESEVKAVFDEIGERIEMADIAVINRFFVIVLQPEDVEI